jgi:hypothetical protein
MRSAVDKISVKYLFCWKHNKERDRKEEKWKTGKRLYAKEGEEMSMNDEGTEHF